MAYSARKQGYEITGRDYKKEWRVSFWGFFFYVNIFTF